MIRPLYASPGRARSRSGAALLLSLLILLVLVAIVMQIRIGTITDERVARNDIGLTTMDLAVESALLQVDDQLLQDAKNSGPGTPATGAPAAPATGDSSQSSSNGSAAATGTPAPASDSRKDEWARPQRTTINEIRLRILVQDEDSKINVLNMLNADEKEAQAAYDRVVRCLDLCREGTGADIDSHTADEMAKAMREYMLQRKSSKIPRPALLSDNPANQDQGLPLSLKEFAVLPPFDESHFRDFRDADGRVVHSIGSFLTVWTSVATAADAARLSGAPPPGGAAATTPSTSSTSGSSTSSSSNGSTPPTGSGSSDPSSGGSGFDLSQSGSSAGSSSGSGTPATGSGAATPGGTPAGGSSGGVTLGGYAVNVNTAPVAVLKSLFDDRDLHPRFFDRVIEYRNTEEEKPKDAPVTDQADQPVDEYGDPIVDRKIFDSLTKLSEVDGFQDLPADVQTKLNQLLTTESHVFSIFVVARRTTSQEGDQSEIPGSRDEMRAREQAGDSLLRVVRSVVWRHKVGDDYVLTPIVRWEVLDYEPFEVQDYPDEKR